jgi:hypothetical protein
VTKRNLGGQQKSRYWQRLFEVENIAGEGETGGRRRMGLIK